MQIVIQDKLLSDQYFTLIIFVMERGNSVNCLAGSDIVKIYFHLTVSNIQMIIRVPKSL